MNLGFGSDVGRPNPMGADPLPPLEKIEAIQSWPEHANVKRIKEFPRVGWVGWLLSKNCQIFWHYQLSAVRHS